MDLSENYTRSTRRLIIDTDMVTVRDLTGKTLTTWGRKEPQGAGRFFSPHGIAVDSRGDLYLNEIPSTYTHSTAPPDWPVLHKYVRVK